MHPEMIRAIAVEQMGDRQAKAQARLRVRLARQARKGRRRSSPPDPLAGVRIPGYVDGTFHQDAPDAWVASRPGTGTPELLAGQAGISLRRC